MIRINLIPYRTARRQQQIMQHLSVFAAVIVVAVILVMGMHTVSSLQLSDLKDETVALQKKNNELKKKIGKIENLANLRADVERKLKIVDDLQEGRFRSLRTLHELSILIPDNIWLKSIQDSGNKIKLDGLGESNKAIANFMRKLDGSAIFSNIALGEIRRVKMDGLPVRKFSLTMDRHDPDEKEKDNKSSGGKR